MKLIEKIGLRILSIWLVVVILFTVFNTSIMVLDFNDKFEMWLNWVVAVVWYFIGFREARE